MSETITSTNFDVLLEHMKHARFALVGEASHGTHEFYRERAEITKRLVAEHGYTFVAAEADWPDAYRVNLFVRGESDDGDAEEALRGFRRFPSWMWRNTEVLEFVSWLREWNDGLPADAPKVGFYGLDLYSLHTSMAAVIDFLEEVDPDAAGRARERYSCFDHFGPDPQAYAYETYLGGAEPCEREAVEQLLELQREAATPERQDSWLDEDRYFYAVQNARLVVNAERYYRAVFRGGAASWNLRDSHMAETLEALTAELERRHSSPPKAAVWAHNSHVGDARATQLGQAGELNIGQLVREQHARDAFLIGFTTYTGSVTATSDWGGPAERKRVRRSLEGSWEKLFHESGRPRFVIAAAGLGGTRLERAIGVIYRPETEQLSHYFDAEIRRQFDAVIHIDETRAVEPLELTSKWEAGELPETYPFAV
jgi:erythromycin esterase-like protein